MLPSSMRGSPIIYDPARWLPIPEPPHRAHYTLVVTVMAPTLLRNEHLRAGVLGALTLDDDDVTILTLAEALGVRDETEIVVL